MPQARLFLPQDALEQWLGSGAAQVAGDVLTLDQLTFALTPAVRVIREVAGGEDLHGLLGCVKTLSQLSDLGGEVCAGSVVLDDCAFEVVEGFVGSFTPESPEPADNAIHHDAVTHDAIVKMLGRR